MSPASPWASRWPLAPRQESGGPAAPATSTRRTPTPQEVRAAVGTVERVGITVVGAAPPGSDMTDGVLEGDPTPGATAPALPVRARQGSTGGPAGGTGGGPAGPGGSGPGGSGPSGSGPGGTGGPAGGGANGSGSSSGGHNSGGNSSGDDSSGGNDSGPPRRPGGTPAGARRPERRRLRDELLLGGSVAVVALLALLAVVYRGPLSDWVARQRVEQAAKAFTRAWERDTLDRVRYDVASGGGRTFADSDALSADVAVRSARATSGLTPEATDVPTEVRLVGPAALRPSSGDDAGRTATQQLRVSWTLDGGTRWEYRTTLTLRAQSGRWRVVWSPAAVHPDLGTDEALLTERVQPARAEIIGDGDTALTRTRTVYRVTFRTNSLIRPRGDMSRLADLLKIDGRAFSTEVVRSRRGTTVEVAMVSPQAWRSVRSRALEIKGVNAAPMTVAAPVTSRFARSLLGEALPASEKTATASKGRLLAGELVGTSGLQRSFDAQLRGTVGRRVIAVPLSRDQVLTPRAVPDGRTGARVVAVLGRPRPGKPLRIGLDARVQRAAQGAVDDIDRRASLVAVDVRDGRVLAVASNVRQDWDRGLDGTYPPGSAFTTVTAWALTQHGATPSERLDCPATVTVDGNPFHNTGAGPLGIASLARHFASSCTTAFAGLGTRISDSDLRAAAKDLGIGVPSRTLGVRAATGAVPGSDDRAGHAAALVGLGAVRVSPLDMAVSSATVAAGRYRAPQLVLSTGTTPVTGPALAANRLTTVRSLLCEAVRSGTARGLRGVPGSPVAGRTGTAEFGSPLPLGQHAWFAGYQGTVAFAVLVEDAGRSESAAVAPSAAFLSELNRGRPARPARSCGI